jgi:outer membrane protein assembly factor BamB
MKSPITRRKETASFRMVGSMLTIVPLWLMLASASTSAWAQTSDDFSNSATTTPSPADWTEFHRDNMQRWNPYETVLGVDNVGDLQFRWGTVISRTWDGSLQSSPAVVNGVVYVASAQGDGSAVYALNANTGGLLWTFYPVGGGGVSSSPAVVNGVVYVGADDGNVYALRASTGALLWSYVTGNTVKSSPAVANGAVYVGSSDHNVYALNASTGARLWRYPTGGGVTSSPAVANGVVYVGSCDGNVYALNASTGARLWSYSTGACVESSPAVANGVAYIGSDDHKVYALDASSGAKLWSYTTGNSVFSSPAVANGVVYVASFDTNLYALNAKNGAKLWSYATGNSSGLTSSPAVANGVVYFGAACGDVCGLNASTGAPLFNTNFGSQATSSITVVNGVVYANEARLSGDESVFALSFLADLFLRIQPTPTTVHQGDLLTYAFPVWNLGPNNAVHEVLNTQVPAGTIFEYIRISGTPGLGTCTHPPYQGTGQIVCHENGSMAPNTTWTVRLTVKVTAPSGTVITEKAATMADTPDPNLANNTAIVSIRVQ